MSVSDAIRVLCAAALVLTLGACEGVKRQLGLNKQSPDEFKVVARAPLSVPPDFSLRPPAPGAPRPQEGTTRDQARRAVFGSDQGGTTLQAEQANYAGLSAGERILLKSAGAGQGDPNIRALVNAEAEALREDTDFLEALVFWREPQVPGTVVDAEGEARRLRENSALGKDITEGQTPSIERRKKGLLEGLF